MDWFRFYVDTLQKYKVQSLDPPVFKAWVNLLCLAREDQHGILPSPAVISFRLHSPEAVIREWLNELIGCKLLDLVGDNLRPHDWEQWQYASDNSSERVRRHRQKVGETPMKRFGNVSVTVQKQKQKQSTESEASRAREESALDQSQPAQILHELASQEIAVMQASFPTTAFAAAPITDTVVRKMLAAGLIVTEADLGEFTRFVALRFRAGGRWPGSGQGPKSLGLLVKWAEDWRASQRRPAGREERTA